VFLRQSAGHAQLAPGQAFATDGVNFGRCRVGAAGQGGLARDNRGTFSLPCCCKALRAKAIIAVLRLKGIVAYGLRTGGHRP
jgi:hypothetical protein